MPSSFDQSPHLPSSPSLPEGVSDSSFTFNFCLFGAGRRYCGKKDLTMFPLVCGQFSNWDFDARVVDIVAREIAESMCARSPCYVALAVPFASMLRVGCTLLSMRKIAQLHGVIVSRDVRQSLSVINHVFSEHRCSATCPSMVVVFSLSIRVAAIGGFSENKLLQLNSGKWIEDKLMSIGGRRPVIACHRDGRSRSTRTVMGGRRTPICI